MPHFRNGYDKHLDLTEDEYLERMLADAEPFEEGEWVNPAPGSWFEGEPHEDTYLPGIPDYDRFNRPSWET